MKVWQTASMMEVDVWQRPNHASKAIAHLMLLVSFYTPSKGFVGVKERPVTWDGLITLI